MIVDACIFNGENDLIELRFNELRDVVDHFFVVEGSESFSGIPKTEQFDHGRFEAFPIDHIYTPLSPVYTDPASGWQREKSQRDWLYGTWGNSQDILICSDTDEIPRAEKVKEAVSKIDAGMCRMELDLYYYNVNCYAGKWPWGTTIGTYEQYAKIGGSHSARGVDFDSSHILRDAGWHFSYFGGLEKIRNKVKSFSHASDDFCQAFLLRDDAEAAKDIKARQDIYRTRGIPQFQYRKSDDSTLPKYFRDNPEKYEIFTEEYANRGNELSS